MERIPPHNEQAERKVLGSLIKDNSQIGEISAILKPEDFYKDCHQRIYRGILAIWDKGKPVDLAILADWLVKEGMLEEIGGYGYVAEIWDNEPTGAMAVHFGELVRDRSIQRRLLFAGQEIVRISSSPMGEVEPMLAEAERKVLEISNLGVTGSVYDMPTVITELFQRIDDQHSMRKDGISLRGVPTGWPEIDEITCGLQDGDLIIVAARPSVGKTALGLNVAYNAAVRNKVPTFFASLEQNKGEIAMRLMCLDSNVNSHSIRTGRLSSEDLERMTAAGSYLRKAPLFIDDRSGQDMFRIGANARRLKQKHKIGLIVIDYLQFIEPDRIKGMNRQEQVSNISRRLKNLARELKVPVLCLAQLNRASEARKDKRPLLSDLRESGSIEQDADVVMLMHRSEEAEGNAPIKIDVEIAKQRNGPTGRMALLFRRQTMRFESWHDDV